MKSLLRINMVIVFLTGNIFAAPRPQNSRTTTLQPFTYENIISFYKQAHLHPTEVQKRCTIFFEGRWKNASVYNYCVILVENSDEDIQITFYLTDAHEMNWVTEFLDAPFFSRAETENLFGLINSNYQVRGKKIGRFRFDFNRWEPRHAQILVFSFMRR